MLRGVRGATAASAGKRACATSYYLTKSMRLAVSANYERLQHSVALSPLVEENYVLGYFAGIGLAVLMRARLSSHRGLPRAGAAARSPPIRRVRLVVKPLLCVLDKGATSLHDDLRHPLEEHARRPSTA